MRLPLGFIGLALLLGACSAKQASVENTPAVIQTDPRDLERIKMRFGDRMADAIGVPEALRNRRPLKSAPPSVTVIKPLDRASIKADAVVVPQRVVQAKGGVR
jgi:hypothetical protein